MLSFYVDFHTIYEYLAFVSYEENMRVMLVGPKVAKTTGAAVYIPNWICLAASVMMT